jgi:hypothetical protein
MVKGKKRIRREYDGDEYKSASAQFRNPFETSFDYTMTAASTSDSNTRTTHGSHTISYNPPPPKPVVIDTHLTTPRHESTSTQAFNNRNKTQVGALFSCLSFF